MTPKYTSPKRAEVSREAQYRAAMRTTDRYKPDGCWTAVVSPTGKVTGYYQNNRAHRRANGR